MSVPPPVAVKPVPLVVSMLRPPPVMLMAAPVLAVSVTAGFAAVVRVLVAPLSAIVPPVTLLTRIPVPPAVTRLPDSVTLLGATFVRV